MKPAHLSRIALLVALCHTNITDLFAQPTPPPASFEYPTALQRLQFKFTTSFFYFIMEGRLEMDSAAIVVSEGENLPYSLYYDEDYASGPDSHIKELLRQGSHYLFKAGALPQDLDSAFTYFSAAKKEAESAKDIYFQHAALALLGRYYLQKNDAASSIRRFDEAVTLARNSGDKVLLFRALANRGTYALFDDTLKEKILNESLQLSRKLKDTVGEIEMLTRIYEIHFALRKFDTVRAELLNVTELEKFIGYKYLHYNYYVLSFLDNTASDYASGFTYAKKAVATMEENLDFAFSNFFYGNMAYVYARFDNYEKSLEWLMKSIRLESSNKAKRTWYHQFFSTALNIAKFGHPQQAIDAVLEVAQEFPPLNADQQFHLAHVLGFSYYVMDELDQCGKQYDILIPLMDSLPNTMMESFNRFSASMDVALYYLDRNQLEKAKQFFRKAKTYGDTTEIFSKSRIHRLQYKIDSAEGRLLSALQNYRLAQNSEDSVYNIVKANQFAQLQIEYETEAKDKNIELLLAKDKVQIAEIRQAAATKNLTLGGIAIMLIVTALVYKLYRNKQKANKAIQEKNHTLEQLVRDKEWLVKEIHHRVKNNFHIVASLLEIQSSYLKNQEALSAIKESKNRIHSMSIIHQKLYQSETLSTIHMPEYIYELVEYLRESYGIRKNIGFSLQIDKIELNHASAITLGLILNEAITNAIKYAFSSTQDGLISISLTHISESQILMTISDNGRGLPTDFDSRKGASMGMELLQGLTDDLGGSLQIENKEGTHIRIIFSYVNAKESLAKA